MRKLIIIATVILIVFALQFGRDILIPFTLAVLLSFLLAPLVDRLERLRLPRVVAVTAVVTLAFIVIGGVGWIVTRQFIDLAEKFPTYRENVREKLLVLNRSMGSRLGKVKEDLQKISEEVAKEAAESTTETAKTLQPPKLAPIIAAEGPPAPEPEPVPVEVIEPPDSPMAFLSAALRSLLAPLGTAVIVILLVVFMLLHREDLRDRIIRLAGLGNLYMATQAMDEAARRVSRYLLMQLIVNVTYGVPVGIGLYLIGIPNALLWGVLAILLRYLPYVGPWIAASMPIALSFAVFDGWTHSLLTIGLFIVLELVSNNIVEPLLYSSSAGVSVVALIVSAAFWTWLWGGIGLLLATPLTVCLAVLGGRVPQLEFLHILLGDQPVLEPQMRLYQRLLASDVEEARDLAETTLVKTSLEQVYDALFVPALDLLIHDRARGLVDDAQEDRILRDLREMIEDLAEQSRALEAVAAPPIHNAQAPATVVAEPAPLSKARIMSLPAGGETDEVAALMLAQLLEKRGAFVHSVSAKTLASEILDEIEKHEINLAMVSALPPFADKHARYVCKRLRARYPDLRIVVGLWCETGDVARHAERIGTQGADRVVVTCSQALEQTTNMLIPVVMNPAKSQAGEAAEAAVASEESSRVSPK